MDIVPSEVVSNPIWHMPGVIDNIDAITRGQATNDMAYDLELEKENEKIAQNLPYSDVNDSDIQP